MSNIKNVMWYLNYTTTANKYQQFYFCLIGAGNNSQVLMTVDPAVAVNEALNK